MRKKALLIPVIFQRWSDKEISHALGVSVCTAERHAERIFAKLGITSRKDVARALAFRLPHCDTASPAPVQGLAKSIELIMT